MAKLVTSMVRVFLTFVLVQVWLITNGQNLKLEHIRTFHGHDHGVRKVVFSPDELHFASGGTRGELLIWTIDGEGAVKRLEGHYGAISDLRYSDDGKFIITAGDDGQIKVWDAESGYCLQRIVAASASDTPVNKVKFALLNSKTNMVYFGGTNRNLEQVRFKGSEDPEVIYSDLESTIQCGAVNPSGTELVFAAGKYLMALDLNSGEIVREYNTGSCKVNALEYSSDGKRILTWCSNSRVDVRDPSSFFLVTSFRSGTGSRKFSNLAFTDDQKYVVTGDHASRFNVWDLDKKQLVLDQWAEQGTIMTFDVENSPNYLLSGSLDKSIKLWQIVPEEEEEEKPKKKKAKEEEEVEAEPDVEIVQYVEPVEDVPQTVEEHRKPANINVQLKKEEPVVEYQPVVATPKHSIESELPETLLNRHVKPIRKEHRLELSGGQLTFEIWDAQVIDGDIVSIYIGDSCIVKEYSITATKKKVSFDASDYKRVYVFLHAHNLGTLPPNTVTMTVSDGKVTHQVELRSDLTGSSALELTFVEESPDSE
ncbi:MAG: WD40 repeat domain-containing protein [Flavobacteriales bacterium]|nr:WD40 repeat domain-containing protein [Flavobacteriales bacterium]